MEHKETAAGFRIQVAIISFNFTLKTWRGKFLLVSTLHVFLVYPIFLFIQVPFNFISFISNCTFLLPILKSYPTLWTDFWHALGEGESASWKKGLLYAFFMWTLIQRSGYMGSWWQSWELSQVLMSKLEIREAKLPFICQVQQILKSNSELWVLPPAVKPNNI